MANMRMLILDMLYRQHGNILLTLAILSSSISLSNMAMAMGGKLV
jgi:multisubunit Na+/H+ antiporter MnhF subunit